MRPRRAEATSKLLNVRLSPAERALAEQAAHINHQNLSQFMRDALVTAASDCLELRKPAVIIMKLYSSQT